VHWNAACQEQSLIRGLHQPALGGVTREIRREA